jgi:hypothetical protein
MITNDEIIQLFGSDYFEKQYKRLSRKEFPALIEVPYTYDPTKLLDEYHRLIKNYDGKNQVYEESVIDDLLNLRSSVSDNAKYYWPLVISETSALAKQIQQKIDARRGIDWKTHLKTTSVRQRVNSMSSLDEYYNPEIDERNCTKFLPNLGYIDKILSMIKAVPTRTRFTLLKPGQEVKPHIDNDPSYIIRMHFPVFTNKNCKFGFIWKGKNYEYHMEVGKVYMVNNGITHWAYNSGNSDRMHLVVSVNGQEDYLENKCVIYP